MTIRSSCQLIPKWSQCCIRNLRLIERKFILLNIHNAGWRLAVQGFLSLHRHKNFFLNIRLSTLKISLTHCGFDEFDAFTLQTDIILMLTVDL